MLRACSEHLYVLDKVLHSFIPTFKWGWWSDGFSVGRRKRQKVHLCKLSLCFSVEARLSETVRGSAPVRHSPYYDRQMHCQVVRSWDMQRHL
jgi:hypothetical protein